MNLQDMVVRKVWGSPVEMWVIKHFEKGSKAHTAFHVYLKSGQCLQLNRDVKCHFRDFAHFREIILFLFFTISGILLRLSRRILHALSSL